MPDINLIPKQETDKEAITYTVVWSILGFVLLVFVGAYTALYFYLNSLNSRLEMHGSSLGVFNQELEAFEEVKKDGSVLQKQLNNLEELLGNRISPSDFVDFIFGLVDPDVIYTSLEFNLSEKTIALAGMGRNYEAVARQMTAFQEHESIIEAEFTEAVLEIEEESSTEEDEKEKTEVQIGVAFSTNLKLSEDFLDPQEASEVDDSGITKEEDEEVGKIELVDIPLEETVEDDTEDIKASEEIIEEPEEGVEAEVIFEETEDLDQPAI